MSSNLVLRDAGLRHLHSSWAPTTPLWAYGATPWTNGKKNSGGWLTGSFSKRTSPSLSNTRNASRISSSLSMSFIFLAIMVRISGKSIVPFPMARFAFKVRLANKSHLIEHFERFSDFFFGVRVFHFSRHHSEELWEINGSISCGEKSHIQMRCSWPHTEQPASMMCVRV